MNQPQRLIRALQDNIGKVIVGKEDVVELILIALLCRGHVLIEDVPGVGKTTLATALARSLDCSFKRIQFTPDVTPSDVTGFTFANFKSGEMEWRPGAVMSQIVLADEINRTSPKTQSSLLEVMEEYQVTVDGVTHPLPRPFIVLATQNPIEFVGTYPLPEAQMDRFFMKISIGYPTVEDEIDILARYTAASPPMTTLEPVCTASDILEMQTEVSEVYTAKEARSYIAQIALATRRHPMLKLGVSTRGAISLARAAQAFAFLSGRNFIIPEDIQRMAKPVLSHRITLAPEARMKNVLQERVVDNILSQTQVPVKVQ